MDLVPDEPRVFGGPARPGHRGPLILTNDGALAQLLAHPSHGVDKEYVVEVEGGTPAPGALRRLRQGVELHDGLPPPPPWGSWPRGAASRDP